MLHPWNPTSLMEMRRNPNKLLNKLGDGSSHDDGIYELIKMAIWDAFDGDEETVKTIELKINDEECKVSIQNHVPYYPLDKLVRFVSEPDYGGRHKEPGTISSIYKKWMSQKPYYGFGYPELIIINAMSSWFKIQSTRQGEVRTIEYTEGELTYDSGIIASDSNDPGTKVEFIPDCKIFGNYHILPEYVERLVWDYCRRYRSLPILFNGQLYDYSHYSRQDLYDLLEHKLLSNHLYPIIHITDGDFEVAFTHVNGQPNDQYYSFVNGQLTTTDNALQSAFRESFARMINDYFEFETYYTPEIICRGLVCALSARMDHLSYGAQFVTKEKTPISEPDYADAANYLALSKTYEPDTLQRNLYYHLYRYVDTTALQRKIEDNARQEESE